MTQTYTQIVVALVVTGLVTASWGRVLLLVVALLNALTGPYQAAMIRITTAIIGRDPGVTDESPVRPFLG